MATRTSEQGEAGVQSLPFLKSKKEIPTENRISQMTLSPDQLAALIAATSFAAGLNVYATVATLGLLARAQALRLPP